MKIVNLKYNMKRVIDFIIEQGLNISEYQTLIEPLRNKFEIKNINGDEATEELVTTVIFWEKHTEIYDTLEKFLNDRFIIKLK